MLYRLDQIFIRLYQYWFVLVFKPGSGAFIKYLFQLLFIAKDITICFHSVTRYNFLVKSCMAVRRSHPRLEILEQYFILHHLLRLDSVVLGFIERPPEKMIQQKKYKILFKSKSKMSLVLVSSGAIIFTNNCVCYQILKKIT